MNVIQGLLDTNILIDVLRGYPPALAWVQANANRLFVISSLTRMEIVTGTRDKASLRRDLAVVSQYAVIYLSDDDSRWALQQFEAIYLRHRVEIIDCLIAATSFRLNVPIYTRNARDYAPFSGVAAQIPYT
jgi:hypothetical protein